MRYWKITLTNKIINTTDYVEGNTIEEAINNWALYDKKCEIDYPYEDDHIFRQLLPSKTLRYVKKIKHVARIDEINEDEYIEGLLN